MKAILGIFRNIDAGAGLSPNAGLDYWRERIYNSMISALLIGGLIALIPSVWLSFTSGLFGLGFFDLIAYALVVALYISRHRMEYSVRALLLILLGFAVGIVIFFATGDEGAGMFWLFAVPPLASLLLGLTWGLFFSILNILLVLSVGYLVYAGSTAVLGFNGLTFPEWLVFGVNFLAANAIVTVPLGAILKGLYKSTEHEKSLQQDYLLLFDSNPLPMWVYDAKTLGFLAVNEAAIGHYGYSRDEFLAMTIKDIRPAEDIPLLEQNIASREPQESQHSGPWKHRKKDGELIDVEIYSHSIQFAERNARLVMANDISERLQDQERLQRSDQILQKVKSLVMVSDRHGSIVYISPSSKEILGYEPDELLGDGWWQAMYPDPVVAEAEKSVDKRIARGEIPLAERPYEKPARTASGEIRWIQWLDSIGPNQTFIGVGHDTTEKKRDEETLHRRVIEQEAVLEVSTALRAAESLSDIFSLLLDKTLEVISTNKGSLWFYNKAKDHLEMVAVRGYSDEQGMAISIRPQKTNEGISGFVFSSGKTFVSKEFKTDSRIPEYTRNLVPPRIGGAAVPIRSERGILGVIIANVDLPRVVEDHEIHLLTTLAEIAGNAIQRTVLQERTEQQLGQFKALSEIDRAILSSLDLQYNLRLLVENVVHQLNVDAANVMLYDPVLQTLQSVRGSGFRTKAFEARTISLGEGYAGKAAAERRIMRVDNLDAQKGNPRLSRALVGEGFTSYFAVPLIAKAELRGVLEIFNRSPLGPNEEWFGLLNALATRAALAIDTIKVLENLERTNQDLVLSYDAAIEGWSKALDLRDRETEGHSQRVAELGLELARRLGLDGNQLVNFRRGALLHDIGKMGIPDTILFKPGPLNEEEWRIMKLHPVLAQGMLMDISYLKDALDIPYGHHERWNGSGYPLGLKGEAIPTAARIFAVADAYDALISDRPYRKAWTKEKAVAYIKEQSGILFDPEVVEAFLKFHLATKALELGIPS